jgi:hypothetical protein
MPEPAAKLKRRPELDGMTLTEKIDALMKEGYGVEDVGVILEINKEHVRQYVFGKKKP